MTEPAARLELTTAHSNQLTSLLGLGCCACTDDCKDGFFLHAGDVQGQIGIEQMRSTR